MGLFKPASGGSYLKAGFLGFEKSGKTHTAMLMALGTRSHFGLPGPLAYFDTEMGSDYWSARVKEETGRDLMVVKSRALVDLLDAVRECMTMGVSVLVVDSVSHVWRETCDSYLAELKEKARKKNWSPPDGLQFQDWGPIKTRWSQWSDAYLTSPLHIVACGRAGFIYEHETNDRGKKELIKVGTKMKAEEFGYEASLLVEMERDVDKDGAPAPRATVVGDRFDLINGKSMIKPTFAFFKPFIERLAPSGHAPVDTSLKTTHGLDEGHQDDWAREKDRREIAAEKIKAALQMAELDGSSNEQKKRRAEVLQRFWGTTSWKELSEKTPSAKMSDGLRAFRAEFLPEPAEPGLVPPSAEEQEAREEGDGAPKVADGEVPCARCQGPIEGKLGDVCDACRRE